MLKKFKRNKITARVLELAAELKEKGAFKNYTKLAEQIGMSTTSISDVRKERRDFTLMQVNSFIKCFNIPPSLIFEYSKEKEGYLVERPLVRIHPVVVDTQNRERVVLVDSKASAGYLNGYSDPEYIGSLPTMSVPPQLSDKSMYGFQVYGNSMEDNICEGDWALASLVEDLNRIKHNYVYVVVCEDGIVIKRVSSVDKENKSVTLTSDNKAYPPYQVALKDIKQLWYVECTLKTSFRNKNNDLDERIKLLEKRLLGVD